MRDAIFTSPITYAEHVVNVSSLQAVQEWALLNRNRANAFRLSPSHLSRGIHISLPKWKISEPLLSLLIVLKNLHAIGQKAPITNLESLLNTLERFNLRKSQSPTIQIKIRRDSFRSDRFRNDGPAAVQTPAQQDLLYAFPLSFRDRNQGSIVEERRIFRSETRVSRCVDSLESVVRHQLPGWVGWVDLNLVDCWCDLFKASGKPSPTNRIEIKPTLQLSSPKSLSSWAFPKLLTPILLTFPVSTNFCISVQVFT